MTYEFIDHDCVDIAKCVACRDTVANTETRIDGKFVGYVCNDCHAAVRRGGLEGLQRRLMRLARWYRANAARLERFATGTPPADAAVIVREPAPQPEGDFRAQGGNA